MVLLVGESWSSFGAWCVGFLLSSLALYLVLRFVIPAVTRNTRSQLDDVAAGILRRTLPPILFIAGVFAARGHAPSAILDTLLSHLCPVLLVLFASITIGQLMRRIASVYLERRAEASESNLDDVLVPLLTRRVIPVFLVVSAAGLVLGMAGVKWESLLTVLGGLSFLLVILFQEPLSNLFGGVYLVVDVPFKYGDLVILEDEKTYRVEEIGSRVTKLYDTATHSVAYVPNSKLAGQRLVNLTQPNPQLRMSITVGVAYDTEQALLESVPGILEDAANAHPHVLGRFDAKKEALERQPSAVMGLSPERLQAELRRLDLEHRLRSSTELLVRNLELLRVAASVLESGGLSEAERGALHTELDAAARAFCEVRRDLTIWLHHVGRLDAAYADEQVLRQWDLTYLAEAVPSCEQVYGWSLASKDERAVVLTLTEERYLAPIGTLASSAEEFVLFSHPVWRDYIRALRAGNAKPATSGERWLAVQPAWTLHTDFAQLHASWHKPVRDVMRRLRLLLDGGRWKAEREFSVDDEIEAVVRLLTGRFLLPSAGWEAPSADFVGFGASSLDFKLEFFVDDIVREHFSRLDDTRSDVGRSIARALRERGIEIPFPQTDIHFRDEWLRGAYTRRVEQ